MRITSEQLANLGACENGINWFRTRFPDGSDINLALAAAESEHRGEWVGWFAAHAPGLTLAQRLALIEKSNDPPYWRDKMEQEGVSK